MVKGCLLAGVLCLLALAAGAQVMTLPEVFVQGKYPATLKLAELTPDWQVVNVQTATTWSTVLMRSAHGPNAAAANKERFFTRGQITTLLGVPYLVLYRLASEAAPITAESPANYSLVAVRDITALQVVEPFDLARTQAAMHPPEPPRPPEVRPRNPEAVPEDAVANLKISLQIMRTAIEQFHADTGAYPAQLTDLVAADDKAPTQGVDEHGQAVVIAAGKYQGPYLAPIGGIPVMPGIPLNPLVNMRTGDPDPNALETHWHYANGQIHISNLFADRTSPQDGIRLGNL